MIERINVADVIVVVALSAALIISIYNGLNELSMSIASGLLGYIGGAGKHRKPRSQSLLHLFSRQR